MIRAELEVKGDIRLLVGKGGLEAQLVFSPDPEGLSWISHDIKALLVEKSIENIDEKRIATALELFYSGSDKSAVIAEGTPAVPPVFDVPAWEKLPVPPELESVKAGIVGSMPAPVVSEFQGKGKPGDDDFILVDPAVYDIGFVRKGSVLAGLTGSEDGVPGKNVFGMPLPVPASAVPAVYTGSGIIKQDNRFVAAITGFVRKGKNWADIVPYEHHTWTLSFSSDHGSCFLSYMPGSIKAGMPRASDITAEAVRSMYPRELLLPEEAIESLIVASFQSRKPLENVRICLDGDAEMKIEIPEDKLEAKLFLRKGCGNGRQLSLRELGELIKSHDFKRMDLARIREEILGFFHGPFMELSGYVLAAGTAPGTGPERVLTFSFDPLSGKDSDMYLHRISAMTEEESGIASLAEFPVSAVTTLAFVKKGLQVAVLSPAERGEPGIDVYGKVIPGLFGNAPEMKLFENLKMEKNSIVSEADGLLEKGERDGRILIRVRKFRDSAITVIMSDDRMKAYVSMDNAEGSGRKITVDDVKNLLTEQGIINGIREDIIIESVSNVLAGELVRDVVLAEGRFPRDGMEGRIQYAVRLAGKCGVKIRADGKADFRNQDNITQVQEGELIAELLPPDTLPEDGWDITGKKIPAKPVPPFRLQIGTGIRKEESGNGKIRLIAGVTGELTTVNGVLDIRNVHLVPGDVDYKCGNIKFPGSVFIKGSVLSGFHVFAGEDILVEQVVQASLLSADGNIAVKQGVKGAGKGILRTKKNISAGFIEHGVLLCVGDVQVEKSCIHSRVRCNGRMSLPSDKSSVFGGNVKTRKGLTVCNLGSGNGARTEVSFGQDYLIADQIESEEREIEKLKAQISRLDVTMRDKEKEGDRSALDHIRKEKINLLKTIEKRGFKLFMLREKFEEHFPAEILVHGTLYPGVIFESHGRFHKITAEKKNVCIYFDAETGRILEMPIKDTRTRL